MQKDIFSELEWVPDIVRRPWWSKGSVDCVFNKHFNNVGRIEAMHGLTIRSIKEVKI